MPIVSFSLLNKPAVPYFCTRILFLIPFMKKLNFCFCLCILAFLAVGCKPDIHEKADRYVVVLSMDGFRSDYPARAHTPTLDSLARVGIKAAFRPCYPSVTFSNHYSMATGLHPDHHGLINNSFYDAELDSVFTTNCLDGRFFGGEPIWNTAERQGIRTATYYWVGSEVAQATGQPSIWKKFDKSIPIEARADSVIAWLQLPEAVRPHLIMWYWEEPDYTGHFCTPDSAATLRMAEKGDSILGDFLRKARRLDIFDKIDFLVVSDHGMATCTPDKVINLNDYLPRDSFRYVFEGVPTLLYPNPTYTAKAYEILKRIPRISVWRKDEIPERFVYGKNPRVPELIVAPEVGTHVQFNEHPLIMTGGDHGFDNFAPEMEAIFYAAGPSFRQGVTLPAMANLNLYLIIARLLEIQPAPNDGDSTTVEKLFR